MEQYPTLTQAYLIVRHDMGAINRLEPTTVLPNYNSRPLLEAAEQELKQLTPEELETFCIGENSEAAELLYKYNLVISNNLLNEWFDRDE